MSKHLAIYDLGHLINDFNWFGLIQGLLARQICSDALVILSENDFGYSMLVPLHVLQQGKSKQFPHVHLKQVLLGSAFERGAEHRSERSTETHRISSGGPGKAVLDCDAVVTKCSRNHTTPFAAVAVRNLNPRIFSLPAGLHFAVQNLLVGNGSSVL